MLPIYIIYFITIPLPLFMLPPHVMKQISILFQLEPKTNQHSEFVLFSIFSCTPILNFTILF